MSRIGIEVNPASLLPGEKIATKHTISANGTIIVKASREIKRRDASRCRPECIHLDHECYDTRFAKVIKVTDKTYDPDEDLAEFFLETVMDRDVDAVAALVRTQQQSQLALLRGAFKR